MLTARLSPIISASTTTTTTTTLTSPATPHARFVSLSLRSQPSTPLPLQQVQERQLHPPPLLETRITTVLPAALLAVLTTPHALVLDIRPHATYAQSRLPNALSLSVPSTLLKRPMFSLDKLSEMLPSSSSRRRFSAWKTASRIIVYDVDSQTIPEGSNIRGLLRKFDNEGFRGDLAWLKGGFAGVWREHRALVDSGPPSPDSSEEEEAEFGFLRAKKLPSSAFQQVSTTTATQRPPALAQHRLVAPAPTSTRPVAANPFYDNIRQNRELEHGITERIPLRFPTSVVARRDDLPFDWLKEIFDKAEVEEGTEALAMQFYMIELREQRRLMGVMDHHSREAMSTQDQGRSAHFPYSITAGVEKGSKNRYTNIWPFEHARVRLNTCSVDDGSDYINASHVQPIGTRRRYIATQGPLPTTFTDFWTLCWEQNIQIIVMLTKQIEGATEKCGVYWKQSSYGPLRLKLISTCGEEESEVRSAPCNEGFDFGLPVEAKAVTVRRTFLLSHTGHPEQPARKVTQLQYLGWPDFDVPVDPRGLLDLMREVDVLRSEVAIEDSIETDAPAPILLHCSAGIGRTGGFIVADAALDGIRREIKKNRGLQAKRHRDSGTDSSAGMLSDESRTHSLSPAPLVPATASGSSSGSSGLRPSFFAADADLRMSSPTRPSLTPPRNPLTSLLAEPEASSGLGPAAGALSKFRLALASRGGETSASASMTNLPSVFSANQPLTDRSTAATSFFPVSASVESSRSPSPAKDAETLQNATTFDYTDPRRLHNNSSPELLSSYTEPVRSMLEDMREQRMSLCQSLRQYVFVHRAIVEGALDIIDEERKRVFMGEMEDSPVKGKRGASPTELPIEDKQGAVRLSKRPSFKRRERSDTLREAYVSEVR
ncbi:hypothetical protein K439DRAFT_1363597 [Ramaria rubella]|nr:hypothetical protein K439DRAFT_1363597 [Ramaria rubella]